MSENRPRIGVLALQGDVREHLAALREAGADAVGVRRPAELDDVQGLVIPGGESTTIDKLTKIFELREPLLKRISEGLPVYGSCAGMIMLADEIRDIAPGQESLGGLDIVVRRNAFGRQVESFETDLDVQGLDGGPFRAVFIRAPWVEAVGPDVEVLASVATEAGERAVAVRQGNLLATSFHPEISGDHRVHRLFAEMVVATQ
ncbi:pyridoxal 5'-phosphate synthase glutaminase subunit PdxT [Spongisporangium articulatum]|uniref:Pyridoxal 5'-phosphate synthase subunit PdxT n=1 Tax=Spongisporangium articulatum TaxID=3362603 RepID=A0ABW8AR41_9ACTN